MSDIKELDLKKLEDLVRQILLQLGEDPEREGLIKTPQRVAQVYEEFTSGYRASLEDVVKDAIFPVKYDEMVLIKDIEYFALCEHHVLPFFGRAHVGYIPKGKVLGFSKIPRIVEVLAKKLQLQERMTEEIATFIEKAIEPQGVGVVVEGMHLCLAMRGAKQDSTMVTSAMKGLFRRDPRTRAEFLQLIGKT